MIESRKTSSFRVRCRWRAPPQFRVCVATASSRTRQARVGEWAVGHSGWRPDDSTAIAARFPHVSI